MYNLSGLQMSSYRDREPELTEVVKLRQAYSDEMGMPGSQCKWTTMDGVMSKSRRRDVKVRQAILEERPLRRS
jgi:hypothetical protein